VYGQSDTPTELIIVRPLWITSTNEVPTDIQSVSETALASMKVCNWISVVGYAWYPPIPWNWCAGRTDVSYWYSPTLGTNAIIIDDRQLPYADWADARGLTRSGFSRNSADPPPVPGGDDSGGGDGPQPTWPPPVHDPYPWLEIAFSTNLTNFADLTLHNATSNMWQLLFKTNLDANLPWSAGQIFDSTALGTNEIHFDPVNYTTNARCFFRAVSGGPVVVGVFVDENPDAFEPSPTGFFPGLNAVFKVHPVDLEPVTSDLHVFYRMSGTASNGWDYTLLSGEVTITNGEIFGAISLIPSNHLALDFDETATLYLVVSNGYLVDPFSGTATVTIHADPFIPVATVDSPVAVDGYTNTQWILASVNEDYNNGSGLPKNNFVAIWTNGAVTVWSGIAGLVWEAKFATVKKTAAGFEAGEMFFSGSSPGSIGWVSADGTQWTNEWLTISGESNHFWGSLYVDTTGIWSNCLIAVSGEGFDSSPFESRNVWLIDSGKHARLLASIDAFSLEGILTLPNDAMYGPWAGKLITGDERSSAIFSIETNGVVTSYNTFDAFGEVVSPSDFDLVKTNQDLYCSLQQPNITDEGLVLKVPRTFLTNCLGSILITQSGENVPFLAPANGKLCFVHWDSAKSNFVSHSVFAPFVTERIFEHSGFAPADLPAVSP
jgi:hypothetical protein